MRILRSPVFIICCILFVLHQVTQKVLLINIPLVDPYLDNVLAMPIILTLLVTERRILFRRGHNYRLSLLETVLATMLIAVVSEVLFPLLSEDFTADPFDYLAFAVGAAIFYLFINPKQQPVTPRDV